MTKKLIERFFNNPNLIFIQEYASYKNMDKIKTLLSKLSYDKII